MIRTILILIITLLMGLKVQARSFIKSYEDFIYMPQYQQDKIIIQTMELVAELEANYEKETALYGHNKIREEEFRKTVQKIVSLFFIDSAYAQTSTYPWEKMGEDFNKLMTGSGPTNKCLYAGWVSETKIVAGKTVCSHPSFIQKSKVNGYQKPMRGSKCLTADGKEDPTKIQCSPLIFGYKNIQKQTLFCVGAKDGSHNSSFDCMKAALSTPPAPDADNKEVRIKFLREKIHANPSIFNNAQEFIYKACVCPNLPKDAKLNKTYHQYMQPHRTCYGLMEMMGETFLSCQNTDMRIDLSIFKSLEEHTSKLTTGGDSVETDKYYKNFIESIVKSSPEEVKRLCSEPSNDEIVVTNNTPNDVKEPGEEEIVIPLEEVKVVGKKNPMIPKPYNGTYNKPNLPQIRPVPVPKPNITQPTDDPPPPTKPPVPVTPTENKLELTCKEALCKKVTEDGKENFECTFKVVDSSEKPVALAKEPTELPQKSDDKTLSISGKAGDQEFKDLACKIVWEKEGPSIDVKIKEEKETTVIVEAVAKDPGKSTIVFVYENRPEDLKPITPPAKPEVDSKTPAKDSANKPDPATSSSELKAETTEPRGDKEYKVCGVLKDDTGKEIDKACVDIKPVSGDPTLTVKMIKAEATAVIIEAKTENDDGLIFTWSIKNPPQGLTIPKGWEIKKDVKAEPKKEEPTKTNGIAKDDDEPEEKKVEEDKKKEKPLPSDAKIITQFRLPVRYDVCGHLKTKEGKEIKTGCVSVEPIPGKKDQGMPPMQGLPPMQLRMPSDTSGMGIR